MDNITYKVLWIDEEERLVEGMRRNADLYGIELDWYTNWEDGRNALERDFQSYSAIILDAKCKLKADKMISMDFLPTVLGELKGIFARKANALPWYVLSAGGWENFDFVMGIINNMREGHEQWGTFLYYKDPTLDNPQNVKTLFKKIVEVASKQTYNKVLARHADAFKYMGEGKLVGGEARSIMLDMLSAMYSPEEFPRYNHEGNPLRKVVECIYAGVHKYGLLPDECYDEIKGYNLRDACNYLGGRETSHLIPTNKKFGGEGECVLPKQLYFTLNTILTLCNVDSHVNPKQEIGVDLPDGELFMGGALQLCYIIRYLGHYVEAHPDVEANKRKIRNVATTSTYQAKKSGSRVSFPYER